MTDAAAAVLIALVTLHRPDGSEVMVNPGNVTSLHTRQLPPHDGKLLPHGACAVWMTDGRLVAVLEQCPRVKRMLDDAK